MEALFQFLSSIGTFLRDFFRIIFNFLGDIIYIIKVTGSVLLNIPSYFAWLPSALNALLITLFSFVVVYKILGREG